MQIIKSLHIHRFRSILTTTRGSKTELKTGELNLLVGNNDAGKSNYLRALNLFFNNEIAPGESLDFWKNYPRQRVGVQKESKFIQIELIISPPKKQLFKNFGDVKWTKTWTEGSLLPEEKFEYVSGDKFSADSRSSFYKWLKAIKFRYVPATKSEAYFNQLMFDLYDVLQKDTSELEDDFNKQIQEKTTQISSEIGNRLGIESVLQFKGSFKELFNRLEFGSKDGNMMLELRGDGVKVRHIPVILQNMAEAQLYERRPKTPLASTIWGFEEPENNLEFASAKTLADNFAEYINKINFQKGDAVAEDEGIQIFITTHSPIFYTLGNKKDERFKTFLISKNDKDASEIKPIEQGDSKLVEEAMRLKPLFELSKSWEEINEKMNQLEQDRANAEEALKQIADPNHCMVYSEDEDMGMIGKLLKANGFKDDEYELRTFKGCKNINQVEFLYNSLKDKFGANTPHFVVHLDKDYMPEKEVQQMISNYGDLGIKLFVTYGTAVEYYFTLVEHIHYCHPELTIDEIKTIRRDAIAEHEKESIKHIKKHEWGSSSYKDKISHFGELTEMLYNSNEETFFHSKSVYRIINRMIQEKTGKNAKIKQYSEFLKDSSLQEIAKKVWPSV